MIKRNPHIANLQAGYLFPEVAKRRREYQAANPSCRRIISLGIGNTTEPLSPHIDAGLVGGARALLSPETYTGYGDEQGLSALREKIAGVLYKNAKGGIKANEVFISDGAKCDIGRLQMLFGATPACVQDPSYPVYVDGSVLVGAAGAMQGEGYAGITYLPCTAENAYFPDLKAIPQGSIIYFCSPNNPTGAVYSHAQLKAWVDYANATDAVIFFDAAYEIGRAHV
jgi:LL-diaminopimelate aminotransferase